MRARLPVAPALRCNLPAALQKPDTFPKRARQMRGAGRLSGTGLKRPCAVHRPKTGKTQQYLDSDERSGLLRVAKRNFQSA
jgi:hypothetical protein